MTTKGMEEQYIKPKEVHVLGKNLDERYIWNHQNVSVTNRDGPRYQYSISEDEGKRVENFIVEKKGKALGFDNDCESARQRRKERAWRLVYLQSEDFSITSDVSARILDSLAKKEEWCKELAESPKRGTVERVVNVFKGCVGKMRSREISNRRKYACPPDLDVPSAQVAIWEKPLPFYKSYNLYELIDWRFGTQRRARFLFRAGSGKGEPPIPIDGKSDPIHEVNDKVKLDLKSDESHVADYLHFFCDNVYGEEGAFIIVEDVAEDLQWNALGYQQRECLARHVKRGCESEEPLFPIMHIKPSEDEVQSAYTLSALVNYGDALFGAVFEVDPGGEVKMIDDVPLVESLGIIVRPWADSTHFSLDSRLGHCQVFRDEYKNRICCYEKK